MTTRSHLVAAALVAICLSAAQAGAQSLVTPVRVGRPDAPMTLTVWAQQDYSHLAALGPIAQAFHDALSEWAAANPGVQLEMSMMPALEQHKAKLLLAAAADRLPDIASIDSFWLPLFLDGGHLQPLNPYWPADDRADFLPFTIETLSKGGSVYGLWHETDCRALFYRTDLVAQPPRTWDELITVASRISRERGIGGYLYNAGRWEATVFDHLAMFWAQGGELVDSDGRPIFGLPPHRDRLVNVLTFLRDTVRSGASPRSVLASNDYKQLSSAAIAGDVAMFLGGNWQINELKNALPPAEFAKWAVAPIPQMRADTMSTGTGGWVWVVFSKNPERRRAAARFILDLEAPPNAARISAATGHLPVRRSVYRDAPVFREEPFPTFSSMLVSGKARPAAAIYNAISRELQLAVGYAIEGTTTPERAVDDAFRAVMTEHARRTAMVSGAPTSWDPIAWFPAVVAALLGTFALVRARDDGVQIWLLPAVVLVGVFLLYPMLELVRVAFTDLGAPGSAYRYTLHGFRSLASDPQFAGMLGVTLVFMVASVTLQMALGLLLAWLFDAAERRRVMGALSARIAVVTAWVIPGVLIGVIWKILLIENRSGLVNYWLAQLGLGPAPLLSSGALALVSVIVANTWRGTAFSMLMQYAGMRRIPLELHEAGDLEGLSSWQRLRWVILPPLAPVLLLNVLLVTIYTLNTFDLILPLTGGGPARRTEVVSLYMYRSAFYDLDAGKAAAIAIVMLGVNVVLACGAVLMLVPKRDLSSLQGR